MCGESVTLLQISPGLDLLAASWLSSLKEMGARRWACAFHQKRTMLRQHIPGIPARSMAVCAGCSAPFTVVASCFPETLYCIECAILVGRRLLHLDCSVVHIPPHLASGGSVGAGGAAPVPECLREGHGATGGRDGECSCLGSFWAGAAAAGAADGPHPALCCPRRLAGKPSAFHCRIPLLLRDVHAPIPSPPPPFSQHPPTWPSTRSLGCCVQAYPAPPLLVSTQP